MKAEVLPLSELSPAVLAEWRALSARAIEPNPWLEPNVVLPLGALCKDMILLVARGKERMHACLPLMPAAHRWCGIPLAAWRTPYPCGSPLVDPDDSEAALRCAFAYLSSQGPRFLKLREIIGHGALATAISSAIATHWRCTTVASGTWPLIHRRSGHTYLQERVSPKQLHNLRRIRRRLEEQVGGELALVDRAADESAMDRFLRLEASGWKGRQGTALLCKPGFADYFRQACLGFAGEGRLRLYCLESGSTTIAMKVMTSAGDGLFELRVAHDERFARFSPGVLLEIEAIKPFHEGHHAWVVSNTNHADSPLFRIWPDRCPMISLLAECPGTGAHAVSALSSRLRALAGERRSAPT